MSTKLRLFGAVFFPILSLLFSVSVQAGLIGTNVTYQGTVGTSSLRGFGPSSNMVGAGPEFVYNFGMTINNKINVLSVDLDDDSVNLTFVEQGTDTGFFTGTSSSFLFTGVTWLGVPDAEITGLSVLENTLVNQNPVVLTITGPDSFRIVLDGWASGPGGHTQNLKVGIEASHACEPVEPDVRTQGFWKRICKKPHPSGEHENLPNYVECVNQTLTFENVDSVDALSDRLQPDPKNDKCEQAEAQFMELLLNVCSGRVATCNCVLDPGLGEGTVGDVADWVDFLLSNPDRTFEDCVQAQSLADLINNDFSLVPCP